MNTIKIDRRSTVMVAHRGVSGLETENTVAAFIAAGNRSYGGIETDVHKTADGHYVVIHDENTLRVSGVEMIVEESTFDELRKITLHNMGDGTRGDLRIPTLEEYLSTCHRYEKTAVLELKGSFDKESVSEILKACIEIHGLENMIFISFDYQNLVYLRELSSDAVLQFLTYKEIDDALIDRLLLYRMDLDAHYKLFTEELIKKLHDKGLKLNAWTVNEPEVAADLVAWGIDYITTNILE